MLRQLLLLNFLLLSITYCLSQQNEKTATFQAAQLGITESTMIDQMMDFIPEVGKKGKGPELIQRQNIRSYMMPVRKVHSNGDELSYLLASCLEFYVNLNSNYKVNLSPDYIALNLNNAGRKVTPKSAFQLLANDGTVSAAILPFGSNSLNSGVYATQKYRINNYLHLFREETRPRQRIFETRKALLRGHPVLIQLKANASAKDISNRRYWKSVGNSNTIMPLIVVGYDEVEKAFEVTSSWGNNWGDNGYIWLSYDDFEKYAVNGFVLVPSN